MALLSLLCAAAFMFAEGVSQNAIAHKTGNERRTKKQCKELKAGKGRRACVACVTRVRKSKKKHHFHPRAKKGKRCRPNNGKR